MSGLSSAVLLLLAAVLAVVVLRRLHAPAMLGYIAVGIVLGPNFFNLAQNDKTTHFLAEIGVVFLMFSIGLEFSLPKLKSMRREVFGLGSLQVAVTMLGGMTAMLGGLWLLNKLDWTPRFLLDLDWRGALVLAGAVAMSSTAIIIKLLGERFELDTPHGRMVLGVLLFQDLAVVPLLVLTPAVAQGGEGLLLSLGLAFLKTAAVLILLLWLGQRLMQRWFNVIARQQSQELFTLNVLLITLGLAWLTDSVGLSMALGSFVAGMLIAETQYRHTVEGDIKPFRDVLLGLFFISLGLQLNWAAVVAQPLWAALFLLLPMLFKALVVVALAKVLGSPLGASLRTGLILCTAGEFGFVLLAQATQLAVLPPELSQLILAAMLISMMLTPLMLYLERHYVSRWVASDWLSESVNLHALAAKHLRLNHHALIIGYGRSGQSIAHLLTQAGKPFLALDTDPDLVASAARAGDAVTFGDARRREILQAAGLARAKAVMITVQQIELQLAILAQVRAMHASIPVIVRTLNDLHLEELKQAGATDVVPEQFEGSLMLASHALIQLGLPLHRVVGQVAKARADKYTAVQAYFHSPSEDASEDTSPRLFSITLSAASVAIGKTLSQLELGEAGVKLLSALRSEGGAALAANEPLVAGCVLVLRGSPSALVRAEKLL